MKLKMSRSGRVEDIRKRFAEHTQPPDWEVTQVEIAHQQAAFIDGLGLSPRDEKMLYGLTGNLFVEVAEYLKSHNSNNVTVAISMVNKKIQEDNQAGLRQKYQRFWNGGDGTNVYTYNEEDSFGDQVERKHRFGGHIPKRGPVSKSRD